MTTNIYQRSGKRWIYSNDYVQYRVRGGAMSPAEWNAFRAKHAMTPSPEALLAWMSDGDNRHPLAGAISVQVAYSAFIEINQELLRHLEGGTP